MISPFDCPLVVDRKGMPVNRAVMITDSPSVPVISVCPECGTRHRMATEAGK